MLPELPGAVLDAVQARLGHGARVRVVGAFPYATTHRTTELEVTGAGRPVRLLLKDLAPCARSATAAGQRPGHRPGFVDDPRREVAVYRSPLAERGFTPPCWAASGERDGSWVLVEKAEGAVLWQLGDGPAWDEAARTLARLHDAHAERFLEEIDPGRLLVHGRALYQRWAKRAADAGPDHRTRSAIRSLARRAATTVDELDQLPRTLIHGEAYPSNILVEHGGRVLLVDWEMASVGPGVSDLAALVAGWDRAVLERLARSYAGALAGPVAAGSTAGLLRSLDIARLQHCIQWLGWSPGWVPPAEHRHDWLATGLELADRLGL